MIIYTLLIEASYLAVFKSNNAQFRCVILFDATCWRQQLLPLSAWAAPYDPILEQIKPGTITIIGETHKKVESVELFQNLALDVIKHYQCVVIGLEIALA